MKKLPLVLVISAIVFLLGFSPQESRLFADLSEENGNHIEIFFQKDTSLISDFKSYFETPETTSNLIFNIVLAEEENGGLIWTSEEETSLVSSDLIIKEVPLSLLPEEDGAYNIVITVALENKGNKKTISKEIIYLSRIEGNWSVIDIQEWYLFKSSMVKMKPVDYSLNLEQGEQK